MSFSKEIVLASVSPRRREVLERLGVQFSVQPSNVEEKDIKAISPSSLVKKLSLAKAKAVSLLDDNKGKTIIAADTIVYFHKVYGKPVDITDAIKMLSKLQGKWHKVYTGVTFMCNDEVRTFYVCSKVKMKELNRSQIEKYIFTCNPLDKAGSYGIQDDEIIENYSGSYSNIVGFPQERVKKELIKVGIIHGNN